MNLEALLPDDDERVITLVVKSDLGPGELLEVVYQAVQGQGIKILSARNSPSPEEDL